MPENVRAFIFVVAVALPAFYVGQQLRKFIIPTREFTVLQNAWFIATAAAFLSGSFVIYAMILLLIVLYANAARAATVTLYIMLIFAAPMVNITITGFGFFNILFDINNVRLLNIVLLLPILFLTRGQMAQNSGKFALPDRLIVGYVLLKITLEIETSSLTSIMRYVVLNTVDVLIPYFAFSRAVVNLADFRKVFLVFVVAVLPLSFIGIVEVVKGWHLYGPIAENWGEPLGYVRRQGLLRASASSTSPIVLGFIIMVAIGCMLAFWQSKMISRRVVGFVLVMFVVCLIGTVSRGPWVGVAVLTLIYLATSSNAGANIAKGSVIGLLFLVTFALTPVGQQMIEILPFVGSSDTKNVDYRKQLFENALVVIERSPWFGSKNYLSTPEMRAMVQGEGIIDVVNTYLGIALASGLIGLGLFASFFAAVLIGLRRILNFDRIYKLGIGAYVRASIATLIAILLTIGTVSSIDVVPYVYWSFAGLCVALIRFAYKERAVAAYRPRADRISA